MKHRFIILNTKLTMSRTIDTITRNICFIYLIAVWQLCHFIYRIRPSASLRTHMITLLICVTDKVLKMTECDMSHSYL